MRVVSVQFEAISGDKCANFAKIRAFLARSEAKKADFVAFPECSITGYWFLRRLSDQEITLLAEPVPDGPSTRELVSLAAKHNLTVGAGLVELGETGELYNTYVVAMPDGRTVRHRKLHAFEHRLVRSGDEYTVFQLPNGWKAGVLICYDNNILENPRQTALLGAEVLIAPHQTGGCRTKNPHLMGAIDRKLWDNRTADPESIESEFRGDKGRAWLMRWLPSRAHDNGMFYVFSNGVGVDDDEIRTGNSMILDPYGRVLAETWKAGDEMVFADLDRSLIPDSTGRMWMKARRPDLYGGLTVRTGIERDAHELKLEE
jgi:predicted amidohydrolase